jgi:hypothetical protein
MKANTIPDLYLEQALLDELPDDKKDRLEREDSADALENLRSSNRDILERYDPEEMARKIQLRLDLSSGEESNVITSTWFTRNRTSVLLAAAALAVLAGVSPFLFRQDPLLNPVLPGTEITRIKGMEPAISLFRKLEGTVEELQADAPAWESDLLQIIYNAAGKPFGTILSIDGRGVVTLHYPIESDGSLVLKRDGDVALEYAYRLDDAPLFEQFFFVTSDLGFNIEIVLSAASDLAEHLVSGSSHGVLTLPDGFEQTSVKIKKEGSR